MKRKDDDDKCLTQFTLNNNNNNMNFQTCTNGNKQKWKFKKLDNDFYLIINIGYNSMLVANSKNSTALLVNVDENHTQFHEWDFDGKYLRNIGKHGYLVPDNRPYMGYNRSPWNFVLA